MRSRLEWFLGSALVLLLAEYECRLRILNREGREGQ